MTVTINANASAKLKTVFFFMVCYAPFLKYLWLCINLVCIISEEVSDFPRKSAGEVSQNCHKVGMPALFKVALTSIAVIDKIDAPF